MQRKCRTFVPFSRDNCRMSTPKTTYNLNHHDSGNVLGHFLLGLASRVRCRNRLTHRQPVGQGSFHHKRASTNDCSSTFLRVNFLTPLQVRGHRDKFDSAKCMVTGQHKACEPGKQVESASFESRQDLSTKHVLSTKCMLSMKRVLSTKCTFSKSRVRTGGWD